MTTKPYFSEGGITLHNGDCRAVLAQLPDASVNCCVTSPPYYGLRDYGMAGQIGLEPTPGEYVAEMVGVFREVRRVLRDDGTAWINVGDSYNAYNGNRGYAAGLNKNHHEVMPSLPPGNGLSVKSLKAKDLIGIPWMLAFALRDDGWYLRCDIVWAKSNCMPESVTDRPTRSHEFIFLLSKSPRYYYDSEAIKEPAIYDVDGTGTAARKARQANNAKSVPTALRAGIRPSGYKNSVNFDGKNKGNDKQRGHSRRHDGFNNRWDLMEKAEQYTGMRNKRDVWTIAPAQFAEAHFATFPPKLIEPCIRAGCPNGGTVLDPFFGAGTTGLVCQQQHVKCIGIELNPQYCEIAKQRLAQGVLDFNGAAEVA